LAKFSTEVTSIIFISGFLRNAFETKSVPNF